jgi:hypothetical protein
VDLRAAGPADVVAIAQLLLRASPGRTLEHEIVSFDPSCSGTGLATELMSWAAGASGRA